MKQEEQDFSSFPVNLNSPFLLSYLAANQYCIIADYRVLNPLFNIIAYIMI